MWGTCHAAVARALADGVCARAHSGFPNHYSHMSEPEVRHFRWSDLPEERVTDVISRKLITGDGMMLAHVYL